MAATRGLSEDGRNFDIMAVKINATKEIEPLRMKNHPQNVVVFQASSCKEAIEAPNRANAGALGKMNKSQA